MQRGRFVLFAVALVTLVFIFGARPSSPNALAAESEAGITPGTVITEQNWEQYKQFMTPGLQSMWAGTYGWKLGPIQLLTRCAPTIVVWLAALMIMRGLMTLGTLVAFFTLLGFVYLPLERFAQLSVVVSAALAAIERIFGFLDLTPEITDHPLSRPFAVRNGTVQFDNVSFGYPPRDGAPLRNVLDEINLHVPGGCRLALVGRSGAGKTTLASLIPRFYDVHSGRVLIDGHDVRHFTLKSLRDCVSLVAQDALLFSASVRDNLLYARSDATQEMLWQSLECANLKSFVKSLPEGLDTIIGERGMKVSGAAPAARTCARVSQGFQDRHP
jgi:ABC-type multidrug transport system fused ATPase/permease subunit